jgi:hypothetical protein
METKQTALEWLENNLNFEPHDEEEFIKNNKIWEHAKQMEKEQIIEAHGIKNKGGFKSNGKFFVDEFTGEQYYNETYGK